MNIHHFYTQISKLWRAQRMQMFEEIVQPEGEDLVLDVGGYPDTWTSRVQLTKRVDCVNLDRRPWDAEPFKAHRITTGVADGCALEYGDSEYEILFSNSVIEHVGGWEQQCAFANEVRRVGVKLWIQTPAYECPIEPHFLSPIVHWLPVSVRRRVLRWFTPWGWIQKPSQATVDRHIATTQLLTKRQFAELFPDCTILTEKLLWIFPKSYVAYRLSS